MNQTNIVMMFAIFLVAALAVGLVVIPVLEEAHARSAIASARNKGQQGFIKSGGQGGSRPCTNC
jgi:hypothetical protein